MLNKFVRTKMRPKRFCLKNGFKILRFKILFKNFVLKFCFKIFLQVIAVKEQCLNFSNDSKLFLINFRDLKKKNALPTDHGRTDGQTLI